MRFRLQETNSKDTWFIQYSYLGIFWTTLAVRSGLDRAVECLKIQIHLESIS